ncbi:Porphobilinogen deaminase [Rubripirellula amarantea]|uniref:Porphobilinogen deaminase n=1 Tax=Rubripirellula amarantea TaxID=2527999 RepID=A0A5C5WKE3_9BACT|nr:hydroxymethylbilane synthase [Rubripirellula amarantea]TWT51258.1 Porphobilinogen deaminase [Rubripirellula amarantea]
MKTPIRIATRQSPLALWQAEFVASQLNQQGIESILVPLVSGGDVDMAPIDGTRQVGVFTKRIQQALADDEADVAVHSLKDLPTEINEHFRLAAVPTRETVADCLVSPSSMSIAELPASAKVGTGSRRRAAQLLSLRSDLDVQPIRGNVQTRLSKLESQEFDAIMLADAGIVRLEMNDLPRYHCTLEEMLPAPGQGALGIEVRSDDDDAYEALQFLNHRDTRISVVAERALLARLHGGCLAPIGAYAVIEDGRLKMSAVVLSQDGLTRLDEQGEIDAIDESSALELAAQLSERLIERGAAELIVR